MKVYILNIWKKYEDWQYWYRMPLSSIVMRLLDCTAVLCFLDSQQSRVPKSIWDHQNDVSSSDT